MTVSSGSDVDINCTVIESCPRNPTIMLRIGSQSPIDITNNPVYRVNNATQNETYMCIATTTRGSTTTLTYQILISEY